MRDIYIIIITFIPGLIGLFCLYRALRYDKSYYMIGWCIGVALVPVLGFIADTILF